MHYQLCDHDGDDKNDEEVRLLLQQHNNELRKKVHVAISCNNYEFAIEILNTHPYIFLCSLFTEEQIKHVVFGCKSEHVNMRRQMCAQARKENNMVFLAIICPEHLRFHEMYRVVMEHRDIYKLRELWGWDGARSVNTFFGDLMKDEFMSVANIPCVLQDDDLKYLFCLAAKYGDVNIVTFMIDHALVDPNAKTPRTDWMDGKSYPLYLAIQNGCVEIVRIIYPLWDDNNSYLNQSPLEFALRERRCAIVDFMLEYDNRPPKKITTTSELLCDRDDQADDREKKKKFNRDLFLMLQSMMGSNNAPEIKCDHCFETFVIQCVPHIPSCDTVVITSSYDMKLYVNIVKICWERKKQHLISVLVQHLTVGEVVELSNNVKNLYNKSSSMVIFDAYFALPDAAKKIVQQSDVTISNEMILYCIEHGYEQHAMEFLATPVENWVTVLELLKKAVCVNCSKSLFEFMLQKLRTTFVRADGAEFLLFHHYRNLLHDCVSCTITDAITSSMLSMTKLLLVVITTHPNFHTRELEHALRLAIESGNRDIVQSLLYYSACIPVEFFDSTKHSALTFQLRKGFIMDIVKKCFRKKVCQIVGGNIKINAKMIVEYAITWTDLHEMSKDAHKQNKLLANS